MDNKSHGAADKERNPKHYQVSHCESSGDGWDSIGVNVIPRCSSISLWWSHTANPCLFIHRAGLGHIAIGILPREAASSWFKTSPWRIEFVLVSKVPISTWQSIYSPRANIIIRLPLAASIFKILRWCAATNTSRPYGQRGIEPRPPPGQKPHVYAGALRKRRKAYCRFCQFAGAGTLPCKVGFGSYP